MTYPAENRTRVTSMATMYSATRPLMPLIVRKASGRCALQAFTQPLLIKTVWPSGLRWLKAPFRKGVGSNLTAVTLQKKTSGCSSSLVSLFEMTCFACLPKAAPPCLAFMPKRLHGARDCRFRQRWGCLMMRLASLCPAIVIKTVWPSGLRRSP